MQVLPSALENLIEELGKLPGVGPRTAERYAFFLLKRGPDQVSSLSAALKDIHSKIAYCPKTFALIEKGEIISNLYKAPGRDKKLVAVVEDPLDIAAIEKTGYYKGTYHVLGGVLSPIDNIGPDELHIKELIGRIKEDKVKEVIIATNPTIEGESTALYIQKLLAGKSVKITRLARGLPAGADIEYADQITLSRALQERQLF
ncbi:recombination protein RecR [Candidatus Saccharibacteria bacterium CPR2]|nr:recombination protein RecR [Candidatus Saccharibacteria bacterium CPR2]